MAATDTTASLQRMKQVMAIELEKSVANMSALGTWRVKITIFVFLSS